MIQSHLINPCLVSLHCVWVHGKGNLKASLAICTMPLLLQVSGLLYEVFCSRNFRRSTPLYSRFGTTWGLSDCMFWQMEISHQNGDYLHTYFWKTSLRTISFSVSWLKVAQQRTTFSIHIHFFLFFFVIGFWLFLAELQFKQSPGNAERSHKNAYQEGHHQMIYHWGSISISRLWKKALIDCLIWLERGVG